MSCPIRTDVVNWMEKQELTRLPKLPNDIIFNIINLALNDKDGWAKKKQAFLNKRYHEERITFIEEGEYGDDSIEDGEYAMDIRLSYYENTGKGCDTYYSEKDVRKKYRKVMWELDTKVRCYIDDIENLWIEEYNSVDGQEFDHHLTDIPDFDIHDDQYIQVPFVQYHSTIVDWDNFINYF